MGSAPCNLFCCTKPSIALPKSDIFVPQINIDIIQNTKNIETSVIANIIEKASITKLKQGKTTEKFLQENGRIRNSLTVGGRNKKINVSLSFDSEEEKKNKNSNKNSNILSLNNTKKELFRKTMVEKNNQRILSIKNTHSKKNIKENIDGE